MREDCTSVSHGSGFSAEYGNPYAGYTGRFTDFFDFGPAYRKWVEDCMMEALGIDDRRASSYDAADIGAGSCFWAQRLLRRVPAMRIVAVEPSAVLLGEQRVSMIDTNFDVSGRFLQEQSTAQSFSEKCAGTDAAYRGRFDAVYFMQSAHYIHQAEFPETIRRISQAIKPGGRLVFQARNLTPTWWPWPMPEEWHDKIVAALRPLYRLADRYEQQLCGMKFFPMVVKWSRSHWISVPSESYWRRLDARWIPSVMSQAQISDTELHEGIRGMRERYQRSGKKVVTWKDVFSFVAATVP